MNTQVVVALVRDASDIDASGGRLNHFTLLKTALLTHLFSPTELSYSNHNCQKAIPLGSPSQLGSLNHLAYPQSLSDYLRHLAKSPSWRTQKRLRRHTPILKQQKSRPLTRYLQSPLDPDGKSSPE